MQKGQEQAQQGCFGIAGRLSESNMAQKTKKTYESFSHNMNQSNISNIVLITKILFCISLKYLKMYSIFFSVVLFFFCKVMLQHVFNNHNNINMNDIQNSNNYSHNNITQQRFGDTPRFLALQSSCINCCYTCIYTMHSKMGMQSQRVPAPLSWYLLSVRGGVAKALPVHLSM